MSRFLTSRAFRSTMSFDLEPKVHVPVEETKDTTLVAPRTTYPESFFLIGSDGYPTTTDANEYSNTIFRCGQTVCRYPFMELPAELRIMIAKYALYVPEGLTSI